LKNKNVPQKVSFNSGFSTLKIRGGKMTGKDKVDTSTVPPIKKG